MTVEETERVVHSPMPKPKQYNLDQRRNYTTDLRAHLSNGGTLADFSRKHSVPASTLRAWLDKDPSLPERGVPSQVQAGEEGSSTSGGLSASRREFVVGVVASLVASGIFEVFKGVFWGQDLTLDARPQDFLDLVTHHGSSLQLSSGTRPPLGDDEDPMRAACRYLRSRNSRLDLRIAQDLLEYDRRLNDICFGAPVSNHLAKTWLEYSGYGEVLLPSAQLGLPYHYVQNSQQVRGTCSRYSEGKTIVVPNWFLANSRSGKELVPDTDVKGFITSDYLLITTLCRRGRRVSIIGGTHGPGTRAFGRLLEDRQLGVSAAKGIGSRDDSFQSVFRVTGLMHDHEMRRSSESLAVEHVDTVVLPPSRV